MTLRADQQAQRRLQEWLQYAAIRDGSAKVTDVRWPAISYFSEPMRTARKVTRNEQVVGSIPTGGSGRGPGQQAPDLGFLFVQGMVIRTRGQHIQLPDRRWLRTVVAGSGESSRRRSQHGYTRVDLGHCAAAAAEHTRTLACNLTAVLDAVDRDSPVVMVGASLGGYAESIR